MNNKGQVLIIFVILLPMILMIFTLVIDLGLLSIEKRKINNCTYDISQYYIKNIENPAVQEKATKLLENNIKDIDIQFVDNDEYVEIIVTKDYNGLYTIVSDNKKIRVIYKVFKENKEIIKG